MGILRAQTPARALSPRLSALRAAPPINPSSAARIPQVSRKQMAGERQGRGKGSITSPTIIRERRLRTSPAPGAAPGGGCGRSAGGSLHQQIPQDIPVRAGVLSQVPVGAASHPVSRNTFLGAPLEISSRCSPSSPRSQPSLDPISPHPPRFSRSAPSPSPQICIPIWSTGSFCYSRKPVNISLPRVQK